MTEFRDAIERMLTLASSGFAKSPSTQTIIQRQLQSFDQSVGTAEAPEELIPLLERAAASDIQSLSRLDMNRVLRGAWIDPAFDSLGEQAVRRADEDARRSSDQALIDGFLVHYPAERPVIGILAPAANRAAHRHNWAWERRAERWELFDPGRGPARTAIDLARSSDDPTSLLREMGLGNRIAATKFGQAAFVASCDDIASLTGARAETAQSRLLSLFDAQHQSSNLPDLVRALLQPWVREKPSGDHRKLISAFLIDQIGDPRVSPQRWKHIIDAIGKKVGPDLAEQIVRVLKRWLTDVAMREFFKAIAKTTDRPDQWGQRSNFWLAYLDAGLVEEAWPALGLRARRQIEDLIRASGERPEYGVIRGGPQSSSSIIMKIGDLRIAEWSDNGSCRFWGDNDPKAPKPYAKSFDGDALRTTYGRDDFEYESHVPPSPGWEGKFAGIIHRRTGISHPKFGKGRGRNWNDRW